MTDEIYNTPQDPGMQEAAENAVPQQPEIPQAYQEPAYGYPPQPAPAPQEGYQQPTYAAQPAPRARKARSGGNSDIPRFISKEKLPVIVGVLFAIFTGAALVNLIGNILGMASYDTNGVWNRHFGLELAFSILMLAGAVLMLLGALLKKPLIVTIGVFVAAPSVLRGFNLYGFIWPWITYGFEVVAVIVIGLYYVLRGHGINALFKKIAVFSGCGLAVGTILACAIVGFAKRSDLAAGTLIYLLIGLISALAMYAGLYLYRPGMRVFQEQPAIIQSGEPYPPVKMVKSLCIVLASLAAACLILGIVSSAVLKTSWLTWQILYAIFAVAGGVLMLIGAMLNRPNKLFSIGILTVALGVIFRMYVTGSIANFFSEKSFAFGEVIAAFLFFLELVCLACIGVHYFFHGNGVSTKWKTILTFVGLGTGVAAVILCDVMLIVHFCPRGADAARIVLSILFSVVDLAAMGTLFLPILFYKRGMMQRVQQPRAPRPQEPQQPW